MTLSADLKQSTLRLAASAAPPTVPRLSTELMAMADSELSREFLAILVEDPPAEKTLSGKRIAVLSTNGVEEVELTIPLRWLRARGATVDLVSPRVDIDPNSFVQLPEAARTHVLTIRWMENAGWVPIDRYLDEVKLADYDAIFVPGGAWNPDSLRNNPLACQFVADALGSGMPLLAICHAPLVLVSAKVLGGRRATGFWAIQIDMENAGAIVVEEPCVVDRNLITGRFPTDLPRCLAALEQQLTG